ncbi:hypothetical protein KKD95_02730 [Patescibacteria group bacterium]|nr:hypothetical protein [Patescibacteria group bacterium]
MRPIALALSASITALIAFPAHADCDTVVYGTVQNAYVYQDIGVVATDKPVLQAGISKVCGKFTYDLWTSTELSTDGPYGNRSYGDELDLTINYDTEINDTPIGVVKVQVSAAYYIATDFGNVDDDFGQVYVDFGRPIQFGSATVTPYVRPMQWLGVETIEDTTLVRAGVRFNIPLDQSWSVRGDASRTSDLTHSTGVFRGDVTATRDMGSWNLSFSAKFTEATQTVFGVGASRVF